ncbi:PAS domain S-box protein [Niveibacterium sp. SC-1]|uniref:hybrid sensor histidine kinase/response regulator n=1 Tax=Niveibacterium sp. SC-1 TaxID=3135646 RepID=UPI00311ED2D0
MDQLHFESGLPPGASGPELPPPDTAMFRRVLDQVPARVVVVDREARFRYVNHEFLAFVDLLPEAVLGRTVAEVLGEAVYEAYRPVMSRLFAGESLRWEAWIDYPRAGRRYVQEHITPYAPDGGRVQALVGFGRDLTELKLRETELADKVRALQDSETLKSSIVDHALAALISTDEAGVIVEFNPAAEAMFGRSRHQALGRPVAEIIIPPRFRDAHVGGMARLAAGGAPRVLGKRMELQALRADGREFPVEMVLWRTDVGEHGFYTASLFDLTERHAAALPIERQREALRQSEKLSAMGSLLAGVAHELNNPLAIVMGRASLLESKAEGSPLQADAQRIREAAERCGRIVRTFLAMARQRPAARASVQINELVRAAVDLLQYGLRSSGIAVEMLLADALPAVIADADQLGQVVLNLLVNAQQALGGRDGPLVLRLETGAEALRPGRVPRVWLRVADNGPGVAEEHAVRIFDPFFTTKAEGSGTGLGLAVARSIVREHGGDLVLEPPGASAGASFRLSIPIAPERIAEPEAPAPALLDSGNGVRVLVVDDEADLAAMIREMLEAAQMEVATAESGEIALALLAEARFDAIVSDLRMPGMDGVALWRHVRERVPELAQRMLFVTGDTLSDGARGFLRETSCPCVEKPFAPDELVARLRGLLAGEG